MHQSTSTASSYRSRIAAHKSVLAAAAPVVAAVALASIANTAQAISIPPRPTVSQYTVFTYGSGASDYSVIFDPIDGSFSAGGFIDGSNPLGLDACGTAYAFSGASVGFLGASSSATLLNPGDVIDASDSFNGAGYNFVSGFNDDGTTLQYVGFRFTGYGASFNQTYYGWAEFTSSFSGVTILRTGIGPNNAAVTVPSAVPEPASAAALLGSLALAGTFGIRRRRR